MEIKNEYKRLLEEKNNAIDSDIVASQIKKLYDVTQNFLKKCDSIDLVSEVPGKEYFAFGSNNSLSRPINRDLYQNGLKNNEQILNGIGWENFKNMSLEGITSAIYVIAISYCAAKDIVSKKSDKKTPGTYFEILVAHLFSKQLGVLPKTRIEVLNLDMKSKLPTDLIYDLGKNKPKFHVPVKTSTRERVIQVWAHQRVLDGVYGVGRFWGTLVCLAETKLDTKTLKVTEICLPIQWQLYQMYIAQMKRIYYLDVPAKYKLLNEKFPKIPVVPFGQFLKEANDLIDGKYQ